MSRTMICGVCIGIIILGSGLVCGVSEKTIISDPILEHHPMASRSQDEYEQQLAAREQELEARFEARLAAMRAELEAEYERRLAEKDAQIEELKRKCDETQDDLDQLLLCLVSNHCSFLFVDDDEERLQDGEKERDYCWPIHILIRFRCRVKSPGRLLIWLRPCGRLGLTRMPLQTPLMKSMQQWTYQSNVY